METNGKDKEKDGNNESKDERQRGKEKARERETDYMSDKEKRASRPIRPRHEKTAITSALVIERKWLKVLLGSRKRLLSSAATINGINSSTSTALPSATVSRFLLRASLFFSFIL